MRLRTDFRFLWITDPWDTLDHGRDTSLRLAQEALLLGKTCYWADVQTIRYQNGGIFLNARRMREIGSGHASGEPQPENIRPETIRMEEPVALKPDAFHSLQYRVDPPVDLHYLQPLQLLMTGLEGCKGSRLVNPGPILLAANEKLEASHLEGLMPPTLVASGYEPLKRFGEALGRCVLKPLHEAQSHGVELLSFAHEEDRARARTLLAAATENFTRPVLLQKFLEGIAQGEQRLWYVDGKLLAYARKLPVANDFRVNIDQGSRLVATSLSRAEKGAATRIGRHLRKRGIRLAAVDLIEGFVTDFNFTSPGLITQMEKILGENLARTIITALSR